MDSYERLTGLDIAFSLRDSAPRPSGRLSRFGKIRLGFTVLLRNLIDNKKSLRDITEWDTLRTWRYSTSMLATKHNVSFMSDPRFRSAYDAAVDAAKRDHWNAGLHFRVHQAIWCADHGLRLGGNLVELGTGRGMMFSAILASTKAWESLTSQVFLFDTFSSASMNYETGYQEDCLGESPVYAESFEATQSHFEKWSRVQLVQGLLPSALDGVDVGSIGFLHIDLNSHVVEADCLRRLWSNLKSGAIVLLDDYAHVNAEKQYDAMNECASDLGVSILTLATGQGILIKP
jgi:hypothetical protein